MLASSELVPTVTESLVVPGGWYAKLHVYVEAVAPTREPVNETTLLMRRLL